MHYLGCWYYLEKYSFKVNFLIEKCTNFSMKSLTYAFQFLQSPREKTFVGALWKHHWVLDKMRIEKRLFEFHLDFE